MKLRVLLLVAVAAFCVSKEARSAVVTFDWLGKITEIQGAGSAYSVGETLKFSLTYDTDALASQIQNGGTTAVYTSGLQFIRFGWEMWSIDNASIFGQSQISDNRPSSPGFVDEAMFQGQNYGASEAYVTFLFTLAGASPQALNSIALPGGFINPSVFGSAIATYNIGGVTYVAELNAIPNAVPEPSTWVMMILGFAVVGWLAYRRSRKLAATA